ncbi:MAG TPA: hypothetical protein VFZ64_00025 [Nocardioidaceae bacterium]
MSSSLRLGAVDELRVRLVFSRVLEGPAHDVFLLAVRPLASGEGIDEAPILDLLEPVVHTRGTAEDAYVVHVNRTRHSWTGGTHQTEIAVALSTGLATTMDPSATEVVRTTLREVLAHVATQKGPALTHEEATEQARLRIEEAFPDAHADLLTLTDEEHVVADGSWSVGTRLPNGARFQAVVGFVDGDPRSSHIRRLSGGEVVDSVGTGAG